MKKEILRLEEEIEKVNKKIELVESQSKSDIMNSKAVQTQFKKIESLQSSLNWTQSKIERVSQKIKDKLKDNYLETECNTAQRNLKKIIQKNNILQLEISKYRYYVPDTITQEDQDSFDTLSESASTGLKSLDAGYSPEKRSLGLSEEIYNDKIKNKITTPKFEIQNSGSFDLSLRQENMPSTLQKTFSTEWSPIRTKKNRTEFRTRLSPIISGKRLKRRNLSEKSLLNNQKRRSSFDLKSFEKKNISRKFPMKKFGNLTIFETYLKFPLARKYFLEWLNEIYSSEIFLFYLDVLTFKEIYDQENAEYLCDHIIEMYINVGAIFEINIEDEERDKILNQWELREYSIDLFDEINEKVFNNLKNDYFTSYIISANFLELVEADSKQNFQLTSNSYLNGNFSYEQEKANILNNEFTFIGETRDPCKLCEELMWDLIDILNSNYSYLTKNFNLERLYSSLEYKKFLIGCSELKMINLNTIISYETAEKKSFFINLYNIMSVHYLFFEKNLLKNKTVDSIKSECKYEIGNEIWSLQDIADHFLKFSPLPKKKKKKTTSNEKLKNALSLEDPDPRIHFTLFTFNNQPTTLTVYTPLEVDKQLRSTLLPIFPRIRLCNKFQPTTKVCTLNKYFTSKIHQEGSGNQKNYVQENWRTYFELGNELIESGDYKKACNNFQKSLKLAQNANQIDAQIDVLRALATVHSNNLSKPYEAINYAQRAVSLSNKIDDVLFKIDSRHLLGSLSHFVGDYEKFESITEEIRHLVEESSKNSSLSDYAHYLINFSTYLLEVGDHLAALSPLRECHGLLKSPNDYLNTPSENEDLSRPLIISHIFLLFLMTDCFSYLSQNNDSFVYELIETCFEKFEFRKIIFDNLNKTDNQDDEEIIDLIKMLFLPGTMEDLFDLYQIVVNHSLVPDFDDELKKENEKETEKKKEKETETETETEKEKKKEKDKENEKKKEIYGKVVEFTKISKEIAKSENLIEDQMKCCKLLAKLERNKETTEGYKNAIKNYNEIKELALEIKEYQEAGDTCLEIVECKMACEPESVIEYVEKSIKEIMQWEVRPELAIESLRSTCGFSYIMSNDLKNGKEQLLKALEIPQNTDYSIPERGQEAASLKVRIYSLLTSIEMEEKNYQAAFDYSALSLKFFEESYDLMEKNSYSELDRQKSKMQVLSQRIEASILAKEYKIAKSLIDESLQILKTIDPQNFEEKKNLLISHAQILKSEEQWSELNSILQQIIEIIEKSEESDEILRFFIYSALGKNFVILGQDTLALNSFEKATLIFKNFDKYEQKIFGILTTSQEQPWTMGVTFKGDPLKELEKWILELKN
ncbi:electron carrier/ protein disulfide oxidoreductase [Anaeramoeba flamelloides]|uniref:Electron carrier/ protein disulfide oxidoreductase n=1 Tax=Anaeramoeba flamelloides TaxID=1746091 RepID=A0ABQ8XHP0_9EUKA|nr:electron carrier/ protein disulfide oxidoreductase [Anaeramoeba flamelloides]